MATDNKYDWQIWLWGSDGQKWLAESKICLVGASSAGCEAFKNLILPGIGKVVIIDDKKVTEQDIKSNFFLTQESLGKNRDEETLKHLLELNPDVDGASFAALGPEESLKEYDLVIATDMNDHLMKLYADACARQKVPIMFVRTYG